MTRLVALAIGTYLVAIALGAWWGARYELRCYDAGRPGAYLHIVIPAVLALLAMGILFVVYVL